MRDGVLAEDAGENGSPSRWAPSTSQRVTKRRRVGTDSNKCDLLAVGCRGQDASGGRIQNRTRNVWTARRASHVRKVESLPRGKIEYKGVCTVLAEWSATLSLRSQIIAGGGIAGIHLVCGQQAMPLRTYVGYLQENIAGQFPLNRQIVLIRILRPHVRRELSEINATKESRPVDGLPARRIQDSRERIRSDCAVLPDIGSLQKRRRDEVASPEWRLGAELLKDELLNGVIKHAVPRADTGLTGSACQFC